MTDDFHVRDMVDELAGVLAGMPADDAASWLIGLCVRLDERAGPGMLDQVLPRLVQTLRERLALDRWPGTGNLWGSDAPGRGDAGGE